VKHLPVEPGQTRVAAERDRVTARVERQEHLPDVGPQDAEQREAAQGVEPGDACTVVRRSGTRWLGVARDVADHGSSRVATTEGLRARRSLRTFASR
jgi:hypothetical protein